jgi:hypothetical protein
MSSSESHSRKKKAIPPDSEWDNKALETGCKWLGIKDCDNWTEIWDRLEVYKNRVDDKKGREVKKEWESYQRAFSALMRYWNCFNLAEKDWYDSFEIVRQACQDLGIKHRANRDELFTQLQYWREEFARAPDDSFNRKASGQIQKAFDIMIDYHGMTQHVGKNWKTIYPKGTLAAKESQSSKSASTTSKSGTPGPQAETKPIKRPEPEAAIVESAKNPSTV